MEKKCLVIKKFDLKKDQYLVPLLTAFIHESYGVLADHGMKYLASHQSQEKTLDRLSQGESYLGFCDDQLVSTITLRTDTPNMAINYYQSSDVAFFTQFAVKRSYQGLGIGGQMMDYIEARARELGVKSLGLDTSENAKQLISMYKKRGYLVVAEHDWDFTNYKSIVMSKRLL